MRRSSLLYLCYLSLDDPLVETQVVAYLEGLAAAGHRVHLLTFEFRRLPRGERAARRSALAARGISWHQLRYHKKPSLPATVYDTCAGALVARLLVRRHRVDVIHARSHVPAAMALLAGAGRRGRPRFVFDIRGLMAEEYEDAGRWERDGTPFRLTKRVEGIALRRADQAIVLTRRVARMLFGDPPRSPVTVIPCCADFERVRRDEGARAEVRHALGVGDAPVLVYVGKLTGWYMAREMVAWFAVARHVIPKLRLLVLTQEGAAPIEEAVAQAGVDPADLIITSCAPSDLGRYLSAADAAISFVRPSPSKVSSSPTKIGEYLGAGLPVVCTSGVGDLDEVLGPDVAVLVDDHRPAAYEHAAAALVALLANPATPGRCVDLARSEFDLETVGIPAYRAVYRALSS